MVRNGRQYKITKTQVQGFQRALMQIQANPEKSQHLHPALRQAEMDALQSQWESLQAEVSDYEARLPVPKA